MSEARRAVLDAVRAACATQRRALEPTAVETGRPGPLEPAARVELFVARVSELGVHVHRVADEAAAARAIAEVAEQVGAEEIACSDSELARRVCALGPRTTFDAWTDRARLVDAELGVTAVQAGIAETGTLVLCSSDERHRLASLVPPVHLALVRESQLVDDLEGALKLAGEGGLPPLVTFVTGPSRTADIELTLVVGVHGPRELHVVLLP